MFYDTYMYLIFSFPAVFKRFRCRRRHHHHYSAVSDNRVSSVFTGPSLSRPSGAGSPAKKYSLVSKFY